VGSMAVQIAKWAWCHCDRDSLCTQSCIPTHVGSR
jgi:hypothetical protein